MSALDKAEGDWGKHEIEPRWIGSEKADCVVALQPGFYSGCGDSERDRFLAGTAERGETALVISMLGLAHDTKPRSIMSSGGSDSVHLANTMTVVDGTELPTQTKVRLAAGLTHADEDLGKRLLNRSPTHHGGAWEDWTALQRAILDVDPPPPNHTPEPTAAHRP